MAFMSFEDKQDFADEHPVSDGIIV